MVKELLQGREALQRGHTAQEDQLVFGSGEGHVEPPPIFQELTKLEKRKFPIIHVVWCV